MVFSFLSTNHSIFHHEQAENWKPDVRYFQGSPTIHGECRDRILAQLKSGITTIDFNFEIRHSLFVCIL